MELRTGAISTATSLRILQGILSGFDALEGFRPDSSFSTPLVLIEAIGQYAGNLGL